MSIYLSKSECYIGLNVQDDSYGIGIIKEVLKTRVKVKFFLKDEIVTYDLAHIKICLKRIIN